MTLPSMVPSRSGAVARERVAVAPGRAAGVPVVAIAGVGATAGELREAGALAVLSALGELPPWLAANGRGWA